MTAAAALAGALAVIGMLLIGAGWVAVRRFARRPPPPPSDRPGVTILKPLHGDEPLLDTALASVCRQDYPAFQVVFGVQDPADPALGVVERLRRRFPAVDIAVVIDPTRHGPNRKVGNLINMMAAARHDILVIADSDVHVAHGYLDRLVAPLADPAVGLVTTLYTGLPVRGALAARLGATQITHALLPGVLLARALGRQDALGATMALRRTTLERIGGLIRCVTHLADDNVLGRLVREAGFSVVLAAAVPATTVPETGLTALWRHELRWARTTRALAPFSVGASVLQYPLGFALLAVCLSGAAGWSLGLLALAWLARAAAALGIDRTLGLATRAPVWLLPLRDLLSMLVLIASFTGSRVEWRGHALTADDGRTPLSDAAP